MKDTPFGPHGTNFYWHRRREVSANDRMLMRFRFRCGLSSLWPW